MENKWYCSLRNKDNSLFKIESIDDQDLIICKEVENKNTNRKYFMYSCFKDVTELFYLISKTLPEKCNYYEVIIHSQKPYFDIDVPKSEIENEPIDIPKRIIDKLISLFPSLCSSDFRLYSSHGDKKWSYHLIIWNYHNINHIMNRILYEKVCNISKYIDSHVYKPTQNLRLLGSTKLGCLRTKIHRYKHLDKTEYELFLDSLVSFTRFSKPFPYNFQEEILKEKTYTISECNINITKELIEELLLEIKIWNIDLFESIEFSDIVKDRYIILRKTKTYFCPLCNREHNNENPFISISDKNATYRCRRNNHSFKLLKSFEVKPFVIEKVQAKEQIETVPKRKLILANLEDEDFDPIIFKLLNKSKQK